MINRILSGWNVMRVIRLTIGIFILAQGIAVADWTLTALGGLFLLMPVFNIGCCGTSGCSTSIPKSNKKIEDTTFEEVR